MQINSIVQSNNFHRPDRMSRDPDREVNVRGMTTHFAKAGYAYDLMQTKTNQRATGSAVPYGDPLYMVKIRYPRALNYFGVAVGKAPVRGGREYTPYMMTTDNTSSLKLAKDQLLRALPVFPQYHP